MTVHTDIAAQSAELARKAWARRVLQRQVEMLGELAEIGLKIARETGRQAAADDEAEGEAPDSDAPNDDIIEPVRPRDPAQSRAMAFARTARAVRLTLMLQAKALEDMGRLNLPEAPQYRPFMDPTAVRKARVERIVARIVRTAHGEDGERIDRLMIEAAERLDDEDLTREVLARPLGDLVAEVCRDLGLAVDWERLAQEPWAVDERDDPRSPFSSPLPLDGVREIACDFEGQVGSGGDGWSGPDRPRKAPPSRAQPEARTTHPHPRSFPHRGGRTMPLALKGLGAP